MTTRVFTSPLFLGFDHLEQVLERASKTSSDSYPPYNIEQLGAAMLRISLAVAGFSMDDLQITQEDNQLVIRGRQNDDTQGRVFIHRGIAARQFQRSFVMAEGIEVRGAWLDSGLLHIDLARPQPQTKVRTIAISPSARLGDKVLGDKVLGDKVLGDNVLGDNAAGGAQGRVQGGAKGRAGEGAAPNGKRLNLHPTEET